MRKSTIAALTIGILLVIGGLRAADLWAARAGTLRAANTRAANLAYILSEYVRESFAAGDASLRQLAIHSRRVGGPSAPDEAWLPSLNSARVGLQDVTSISVTDASGIIRHSTQRAIVGQSRAHEFAFTRLAAATGDDLVVSEPFLTIVEPRVLIIPIARRLTTASGAFDGIVVASLLPSAHRGFFRTVDVGQRGVVTVYHPNGALLFREPSEGNPTGMRADSDPVFAAARRSGGSDGDAPDGLVEGPLVPGGPTYLSAFRTTQTPPLVVAVSLDRDEVLANSRRQTRILLALSLGIAATMIATLAALFRQMDAKFRAEQEARLISEEAGRLKEEFLMTVSHELRTPLQSILGWANVLMAGGRTEATMKTALQSIERNVGMQTRLIDDLLDVSRAVSGRLRIELKTVDVAEIVGHVVDNSRPAATAKAIQFALTATPAPPMAADPVRLQQIVWNLVSNAIKFTPEGGRVDVRVGSDDGHIEIAVADSGIGIEPEFLPHVFERFRQADGSTTRRYGGLGLGLAIVRHLTELHGGVVSAESAGVDRGATFRVRFPVHPTTETTEDQPQRLRGTEI